MVRFILLLIALATSTIAVGGSNNHFYQASMHQALALIKQNHAYLSTSGLDWSCLERVYIDQAAKAQNSNEILQAFEHLVLEFADNHMMLNTNNNHSYRLYSPVLVNQGSDGFVIHDFWKNNLINHQKLKVGSQLLSLNGATPQQIIDAFPTSCLDKTLPEKQEWIINKALAGIYSKSRLIKILNDNETVKINLDELETKSHSHPLKHEIKDNIGIITINNALGNIELIEAFDQALNQMMDTDGLILDLRNTISGGDSYMARAIIGRLISKPQAYQKHQYREQRGGAVGVNRIWIEYVEPRGDHYDKPMVVLSNHWTGSMGEGLTIGLQGMNRATWIGTEMAGLLGAVNQFKLNNLWFSIQMPIEMLFSTNGTPREYAQPDVFIQPSTSDKDDVLLNAISYLKNQAQ